MQLGPIAEWGLNMNKKTIEVNTENFQTSKPVYSLSETFVTIPVSLDLYFQDFMKQH